MAEDNFTALLESGTNSGFSLPSLLAFAFFARNSTGSGTRSETGGWFLAKNAKIRKGRLKGGSRSAPFVELQDVARHCDYPLSK